MIEKMEVKEYKRQVSVVDWVILDEICEIVKFEAMNLVDNLLLINSPPKMTQLAKVKKHKHVVFAEEPVIIEYERYLSIPVKKESS